jgi:hypothetical protein
MANKANEKNEKSIAEELEQIKRLLVLLLLKQGVSQDEIGAALRVFRTTVGRMFPGHKIEPLGKDK